MKTQYKVRNWDTHFENSQSRKVNRLNWVAIPNKHDGKSYRRLITMENGPSIYAAWVLLLQVASKCPKRGVLADDDGPLDADDLAAKTGCSEELFDAAFAVLSDPRIGWLDVEPLPATGSTLVACSHCAPSVLPARPDVSSLKGTEPNNRKGREKKKDASSHRRKTFKKPTVEQVKAYCLEAILKVDPEAFVDYYESNGWRVGKGPMKDWKACVRNWGRREVNRAQNGRNSASVVSDPRGNLAAGQRYLESVGGGHDD